MVATRSKWATDVAVEVLADGGNAVDAAVAAGFAIAVTYPGAGNLGGGGFMVIRMADGTAITNDHREKAPLAARRNMYLDDQGNVVDGLSTASHLAVGVPGTVDGLLSVHERFGSLPLKRLIDPSIALARRGIELDEDLAASLARSLPALKKHPASADIFSNDGEPYAAGDRLVQSDLASTLTRIKREGRDGFYAGRTAELIVAEMADNGGLISLEDLAQYRSVWREPIRGTYRGHEILSMPPPSSGGVLLVQMLNMLEPFNLSGMGFGSADAMHIMVEAQRRAYADRAEHLGDSDFYPVPISMLTSKSYARERFADFSPRDAGVSESVEAGKLREEGWETTHLSFMDGAGNAVAYTTTLNLSYGSKIVADGTGVLLNNEMDDFSAKQNTPNFFAVIGREANAIEPGKRMLSSMTPTIVVRDGKPFLVTGSPGGSTIITTTLQVIVNVIDHEMPLNVAVASPRFHHQWLPDRVTIEAFGFSPDTLALLAKRGHLQIRPPPFGFTTIGDANSVMRTSEGFLGMADPRNAGTAGGP